MRPAEGALEALARAVAEETGGSAAAAREMAAELYTALLGCCGPGGAGEGELARLIAAAPQAPQWGSAPRVACPGVEGAFTHQACRTLYPGGQVSFYPEFADVFEAVEEGRVDVGVLPIENSTAGSVLDVYTLLGEHRFFIVDATSLPIEHCLLAPRGAALDGVRQVYSHPQALGQCRHYLAAHPSWESTPFSNTAAAAKYVKGEGDCAKAAIASALCAQLYDLQVLEQGIEDASGNRTRFIAVAKEPVILPQADRVSILAVLPHRKGSLFSFLARFAAAGLNLCKIESRPIPGRRFEFVFYLAFEGSVRGEKTLALLSSLEGQVERLAFLGNYPDR